MVEIDGGDKQSMHELQVAMEIIEIVQKEMAARQVSKIKTVGIRLGTMSGFDPEALRFSFEAATAETSMAGAELDIENVPVHCLCNDCGEESVLDKFLFFCPKCGSPHLKVTDGDELKISYIEGE